MFKGKTVLITGAAVGIGRKKEPDGSSFRVRLWH